MEIFYIYMDYNVLLDFFFFIKFQTKLLKTSSIFFIPSKSKTHQTTSRKKTQSSRLTPSQKSQSLKNHFSEI